MVGNAKQGYAILAAMAVLWVGALAATIAVENAHPGVALQAAGAATEGKEVRFGIPLSAMFAVSTTLTSTGAIDSTHSSYTGIGGGILLLNMLLGEIAPGGAGSGLYGMLVLAIITVFVAGLMVGRTPTYLGKRIGATEMKFAASYLLVTPAVVLLGSAVALALPAGQAGPLNSGPHALTEIMYAFGSAGNNNGSAFAGLSANTDFYNIALGRRDAHRPAAADRPGPRAGRIPCPAGLPARRRRNATDLSTAIRGDARRRRPPRRRPDLPAGARARPARRRTDLMTTPVLTDTPRHHADSASGGGSAPACSTRPAWSRRCRTPCVPSTRGSCGGIR